MENRNVKKNLKTKTRTLLLTLSLKMIDTIIKAITLGLLLIIGGVELNPDYDSKNFWHP